MITILSDLHSFLKCQKLKKKINKISLSGSIVLITFHHFIIVKCNQKIQFQTKKSKENGEIYIKKKKRIEEKWKNRRKDKDNEKYRQTRKDKEKQGELGKDRES